MRILLTGASGFLGSRVLALLEGHQVLCLSRHPGQLPRRDGVDGVVADLGQTGAWMSDVARFKPDWCLHLAWEGLPDYSLERCRMNLDAGLRLVHAVAEAGVTRMVVAGSCWEYGRASGPVAEHQAPVEPGIFAATKLAFQTILDSVARESSFDYRWARVFFVYGPGQRQTSLIPSLRAAYLEGRAPEIREPAAVQDFVHIDDVASALVALTVAEGVSGVFNVGSGQPTSVGDVANRVADYYGRPRPFATVPDGRGFWADMSKMAAGPGWRPRLGTDEGIRRTLAALDGVA